MKNGIKTLFVALFLLIAAALTVNANYGDKGFGIGTFHEEMENIVEEGSFQDLQNFREENSGFGGPRWVVDEESFNVWKEHHELMGEYMGESEFQRGYGMRGKSGSSGCPMRGNFN